MNNNLIIYIIYRLIEGTPVYVWFLLIYLIKKGINASKDKPLDLKKMLIMPVLFAFWGLDKMFTRLTNPFFDLSIYFITLLIGSAIGYLLYLANRKVYYQKEIVYRTGSFLPLCIILVNFCIKYTLNVLVAVQPNLYAVTSFCLLYSAFSGLSVGLFAGGWVQAFVALKQLTTLDAYHKNIRSM